MSVSIVKSGHEHFARAIIDLTVQRMLAACFERVSAASGRFACLKRISADSVFEHFLFRRFSSILSRLALAYIIDTIIDDADPHTLAVCKVLIDQSNILKKHSFTSMPRKTQADRGTNLLIIL